MRSGSDPAVPARIGLALRDPDLPNRFQEPCHYRSRAPMNHPSGHKPFAGIRIVDCTRYLAGPFGTYQLALLGADVIKIEPKAGDDMRLSSSVSRELTEQKLGPSFLGINANK